MKKIKITKRDAAAILALMDTLIEWEEHFQGSYKKDWDHYWRRVKEKLYAIERGENVT